jgi:hypothetical protein
MVRCALLCLSLLVLAFANLATANPNNSIDPDRVLPTPYGLKIVRSSEARANGPVSEQPQPSIGMSMEFYQASESGELPVAGLSLGRYLESVESAESLGGPYSADLAEPLAGLGQVYQAQNKHPQALDFFRRALHLSRINEGLYSANQLPVLQGMINSQLAMGQLDRVDENQDYRFRIQRRLYSSGDPSLLQATLEYSEWQRAAYLEGLGGDTYLRLLDMHDVHSREVERLEESGENTPMLIRHLRGRLRAEYLISQYEGEREAEFQINIGNDMAAQFAMMPDLEMQRFAMIKKNNFRNGRRTLEQIVELLEEEEPQDTLELARAKVALGDWLLWWDWMARALQSYEQAYEILEKDGEDSTDPDSLFADFVELPEERIFHPAPISLIPARQAHATVMFDISRLGRARDVEIVEIEPADSEGARISLFSMLREIRFRPSVVDGKVVEVDSVVREYNFEY